MSTIVALALRRLLDGMREFLHGMAWSARGGCGDPLAWEYELRQRKAERLRASDARVVEMPKFPSLGTAVTVPDIMRLNPEAGRALFELHEAILRQPSALTEGQRELIAAYVSGLNGCRYCYGVHAEAANAYGEQVPLSMEEIRDGEGLGGVDDRLRPVLQYARKLTEAPSSVTAEDAQAVYDAGWDEQALHDAILVVCCFNFMNRLLDGHGVHGDAALFRSRGRFLQRHGYRGLIDSLRR